MDDSEALQSNPGSLTIARFIGIIDSDCILPVLSPTFQVASPLSTLRTAQQLLESLTQRACLKQLIGNCILPVFRLLEHDVSFPIHACLCGIQLQLEVYGSL